MSSPFLIWTMQRTGGTSLTDLLMEMSEHRGAEHEPFNWAKKTPRQFWPITEAWNSTKNVEVLRASLEGIFSQRYLIKHCYELLSMSFDMHLMQVSAATSYKHILLLRRDEASRLLSKFIAEAQGTWFKDYSRKVFTEVTAGDRQLDPLPVEKIVAHFKHCQDATKFVRDTLAELGVPLLPLFHEDLYTGERATRLEHLQKLFDFLNFTSADLERDHDRIEEKIFNGGQNTVSVAPFVPNLAAVLDALEKAGCDMSTTHLSRDSAMPMPPAGPGGPRERIARECAVFAETYKAEGPFLEIGGGSAEHSALLQPYFNGQDRTFVSPTGGKAPDGIEAVAANPNDMRETFDAERFGTVLWTSALSQDRYFWRTLDEIKRVLSPGGTLIVVTPGFKRGRTAGINITGLKGNPVSDATVTYGIHTSPDYWRISPQALQDVILEGFEVREVRTMMTLPRIFGIAVKPR